MKRLVSRRPLFCYLSVLMLWMLCFVLFDPGLSASLDKPYQQGADVGVAVHSSPSPHLLLPTHTTYHKMYITLINKGFLYIRRWIQPGVLLCTYCILDVVNYIICRISMSFGNFPGGVSDKCLFNVDRTQSIEMLEPSQGHQLGFKRI